MLKDNSMIKMDITAIVLTYNESIHIERCLKNLNIYCKQIIIVDSHSSDNTTEIARTLGADIFQHKWVNYATQFNWALKNITINTEWLLRIDADEYLYPELIEEIKEKLIDLPANITGVVFNRRHIFMGRWIKRGTYPVKLLRLFRTNKGFCEQRWMDEHICLTEGGSIEFENDFADHNLNNLDWWIKKHNDYTIREAIDLLDIELGLLNREKDQMNDLSRGSHRGEILNKQAATTRRNKLRYIRLPLFWRSFLYFIYRYLLRFGFLELKEGFIWHFLQGWWYRTLVDAKIWEVKKACGTDKEKIKEYIKQHYSIEL